MENHRRIIVALFSWILLTVAALVGGESRSTIIKVDVGVVLDLDESRGKMYLSCIKMALDDFYESHAQYKTRLNLKTRNSNGDVVGAAAAALDLIKNEKAKAILGPTSSMQTSFVVSLGEQAKVPIVSFSATSPSLTSSQSPYFFRFAQNDKNQVKAISGIVQTFGWRRVVPIYVDNIYGEGVMPFLVDALLEVDALVPYRSVIHESASDDEIAKELYKLTTMPTRVFVVHMEPQICFRLFSKAKEMGMMNEGFVWITTTNSIGDNLKSMAADLDSMQGLLGVESYFPRTTKLRKFKSRWKAKFQLENPKSIDVHLDAFGLRAYDATFSLAMAFEKVANIGFMFQKRNGSSFNTTDLDIFEVSRYGSKLSRALSTISFKGLAGHLDLVDRELKASTFKIVNVNGDGVRTVGYWTPQDGCVKTRGSSISTSKCNFLPIIWPGDSILAPRGWVMPTNSTKLRIGVPANHTFAEFVNVSKYPNNTVDAQGFVIDIFKEALEILQYALPYEFVPFEKGTYSDMVQQVHDGIFDAVVGDVTIRASRSLEVGFTMPYSKADVVMVVPILDNRAKSAWVFLKPLTLNLWMTTLSFFIFIGFVIWVLEHRINEDFQGSTSHQVGTSFWFSFSTMVFSQRETIISNLSRFVMIVWIFVLLILTQSYTANLASLLTIQQLQPTVTDLNELLRNGENVGYFAESYIEDILKSKGFHPSKLKAYRKMEDIEEALSKGSANGGIAAIFHESPYMKLFIARYCSKYTMIGPIFETDGFAFVFPKGSPLIDDISQAILNLTDSEEMMKIQERWIKNGTDCKADTFYSSSLGLESFWVLFLITGVVSIFALLVFTVSFFHKHKHVLMSADSRASKWKMIKNMFKTFIEKEENTRIPKRRAKDEARVVGASRNEVTASKNNNGQESPFSYSDKTDATFAQLESPSHSQASPRRSLHTLSLEEAFTNHEMHANPEIAQESV